MKIKITIITLLLSSMKIFAQSTIDKGININPLTETGTYINLNGNSGSSTINFKGANGFWHLSGPRYYDSNNQFSIFWNKNGQYLRYFDILDNGNIGIGTANPLYKLHVVNNSTGFGFDGSKSTSGYTTLLSMDDVGATFGHNSSIRDLKFKTGNSINMTLFPNGNVGIGTNSSTYGLLSVRGSMRNLLRLEQEMNGEESVVRFRAKSAANGSYLHGDIALYSTGPEQGYLGFKVPYNDTTNSGFKLVINEKGNVGIGSTNPLAKLTVRGNVLVSTVDGPTSAAYIRANDIFSNATNPDYTFWNDDRSGIFHPAANTIGFSTNALERLRITADGNVGIGTLNPGAWKLAVNGKIRAKEVNVNTGWSDFVFYDNYVLPTLEEVEHHIKEKGHLKDIPSAAEVAKDGILLGEMNAKLLQKIEELTLYIIAQDKKIKSVEAENKKLASLEDRLKNLEKNQK